MNAIEIQDLSFTYRRADRPALSAVDFVQAAGEAVALIGRTGAGKSSLGLCLNRIIPAFFPGEFSGRILLHGQDVAGKKPAALAGVVGVVIQDFESQLFSTRADLDLAFGPENLGLPREEIGRRIAAALQAVGLEGFAGRDPSTLSGGQKQRLAIASTLTLSPGILCLDEPTTDLDPAGKAEVAAIVKNLAASGATLLLIDHEADGLRAADRIAVLEHGKIIHSGPRAEIFRDLDLLERAGVRPLDAARVCDRLGLKARPLEIAEAAAEIKRAGFVLRVNASAELLEADRRREAALGEEMLRFERVGFSYPGGAAALSGVNLSVRRGDFVAVVGANGSGKTTLVKHCNGLHRPTTGAVFYRGRDLAASKVSAMGREVGFVFQNPDHQIFSPRVREEVAFGPRNFGFSESEVQARVTKSLATVGLEGREEHDPFLLTKGERQRLAVASVLAPEPAVLVLDEPTTGLDYPEQRAVMEMLAELNRQGRTVIIITHTLWLAAEYARRTVLMAGGQIIADGPTREVLSNAELLPRASLRVPPMLELGQAFGLAALTAEEFAKSVRR